jgi:arylsulfatase A-like enzyme
VQTPNLDHFAGMGVLFANAYTAFPSCIPARAAIHTGLSPYSHGKGGQNHRDTWDYDHLLAGEFAKAGYYAQAVGKMHVSPTRKLAGFHHVILHDGYWKRSRRTSEAETDDYLPWLRFHAGADVDMIDHGLDCNSSTMARPWHLPESLHPTNWVVTQSIDFLRRRDPTMPFFLFMSFVAPHPPLTPPQVYFDQYILADIPDSPIGEWADKVDVGRNGLNPVASKGIVGQARLQQAKAGYYGSITHIDHQIGRFRIAMQEFGVWQNTIVLFASDHGDMLGDHHLFRKGLPYEGSAKVPFILYDPTGLLRLKKGHVADEPVELMDIMPTLLEAAGIPIPTVLEGKSVLPLARGEQAPWRDYVHGEYSGGNAHHYLTDGVEKYIHFVRKGVEQLFDLRRDPQELHNLVGDPAYEDQLHIWRRRLHDELEGRDNRHK